MSKEMNPEKYSSNIPSLNTIQSTTFSESTAFADKMKEVRSIIASILPENKQKELITHLQELNGIYQMEIQQERIRSMNGKMSECEVKNLIESDLTKDKARTSEKVILEVREGGRFINQVKTQTQKRLKSPDKKVEEKKFMKFEPKKINKSQQTTTLANILKPHPNI